MRDMWIGVLCVGLLLCLAGEGYAQIFTCKDVSGKTITADRVVQDCATSPVRELNREGILKKEIAAPLTAEQKRQKQIQEEKHRAEEALVEEQRSRDRSLLVYHSEKDIEAARKRSIAVLQEQIAVVTAANLVTESQLKDARNEKDFYKKKGVPPELKMRVDSLEQTSIRERKNIETYEGEIVQVNMRFDEALKRYRELTITENAKTATPVKP